MIDTSRPTGPGLQAEGLTKRYGDRIAVSDLSFEVQAGECLCLLGANGAGKTTTLNMFLGFARPDAGQARVFGLDVAADPDGARRSLGYVSEVVTLYPALTGAENLGLFASLAGRSIEVSARDALLTRLRFPLEALAKPSGDYSKGMRQKLGLAIALSKGARAILLDEPLSGLDPAAANDLVEVLQEAKAEGVALLISTHDIFRAKDVADRLGIMRDGRLLQTLDPSSLTATEIEKIYLSHMAGRAA